jgi:hypothetical protein
MGYLGMARKGSSVIQAMLKRLDEEELQQKQKQNEARMSVDAAVRPKARTAAA